MAWNVGRTGHMVPFAMLEPVQVSGVTVKLATLHNEEDLKRKDVREGDEVIVMRAGDVIPQVVSPTPRRSGARAARAAGAAEKCPACGTPTVKPEDGVWTICPNRAGCPGQVFQAVKHFVGAMDIDGLGEENVRRFLREGLIESIADIYELDRRAARGARGVRRDLGSQPGRGDRARRRSSPSTECCTALGIPGIGYVNARNLAAPLPLDGRAAGGHRRADRGDRGDRPDHGQAVAETLAEERTRELIERLRGYGLNMEEEGPAPAGRGPAGGQDARAHGDPAQPDAARTRPSASRQPAAR